jgi:hypothetical protein
MMVMMMMMTMTTRTTMVGWVLGMQPGTQWTGIISSLLMLPDLGNGKREE